MVYLISFAYKKSRFSCNAISRSVFTESEFDDIVNGEYPMSRANNIESAIEKWVDVKNARILSITSMGYANRDDKAKSSEEK
jgi:hypothetical protein